ncbi:MAG: hybrid sensor histidine kinase/response regulator, partial [Caulobacter sp.]|nr:hybrid sensor histidine kinase/response regulator [Caulobacter sp.]
MSKGRDGSAPPPAPISAWLIPLVPPPAWRAALATLIATATAFLVRLAVLGFSSGLGATTAFFPAIVLVSLYAGWRWALAPIAAGVGFAWWLWSGPSGRPLVTSEIATLVLFVVSAGVTAAVAQALRDTVIRLDEARRARFDAEARLQVAQSAAGVGTWEWDIVENEVYWSATFRENLGLPLDAKPSMETFLSALHADDHAEARATTVAMLKSGERYENEHRVADRGDGERWVHARGDLQRDDFGRAVRVIGVNFDVTARRQAEESLRESEARFRALADSAPALMWISEVSGQRSFVNAAYLEFAGVDYEGALNLDWRTRLQPEDLPRMLQAQISGETARKPFDLEGRYRRADGEWRWLKSFSQPRLGPGGEFVGFMGIAFDVTDAKRAEADLTNINELLAERVQGALIERDAAQAALMQSQKLEAIGQLTGGVAHDFNNLLTVVIGALDVVQRHPDDKTRRERLLGAALAAARRGERLTQHLLAFARRQPLRPEVCRIDRLIAESEALLRRAVGETVSFSLRLGAGVRTALTDAGQFEAALLNLVVNARDATPAGGEIVIESAPLELREPRGDLPAGRYLRVAVRDSGAGMDAATIARAFEPFFTTKAAGKGTGLGLSQVYGFARQSGGAVEIHSTPGAGATVALLLPASSTPAKAAEGPSAPPPPRDPARLLLVEDDADVGDLVEAMLVELGHAVVRAGSADEALALTLADPAIELVMSDVMMPGGKSGVDLAQALGEARPGLPVLLTSGYTGEEMAAQAGPWPLLRKPYALDTLAKALETAWERVRE